MKRLNPVNNNEPIMFNDPRYIGNLACYDMERERMMAKYFTRGKYLSVGCLNTAMLPILAERKDVEVHGIDFADRVMAFLGRVFPNVTYVVGDIRTSLPYEDNSMDYIVAGEVIEHLEHPAKFIMECLRVLKPGGWLSISTPWEETVKQGAVDREAHVWSYSIQDMEDFGFTEIELLKDGAQTSIIAWRQK